MASMSLRPRLTATLAAARQFRALHTTLSARNDSKPPSPSSPPASPHSGENKPGETDSLAVPVPGSGRDDIKDQGQGFTAAFKRPDTGQGELRRTPLHLQKGVKNTNVPALHDGPQTIPIEELGRRRPTTHAKAAKSSDSFRRAARSGSDSEPHSDSQRVVTRQSDDRRAPRRPFQRRSAGGPMYAQGETSSSDQPRFPRQSDQGSFDRQSSSRPNSAQPRRGRPGSSMGSQSDRPANSASRYGDSETRRARPPWAGESGGGGIQRARPAGGARKPRKRREGNESTGGSGRKSRHMEPWSPPPPTKIDLSWVSLFGRESVLTPILRPPVNPAESYWAKGMDPAEARKQDVLRQAGSYEIFTPSLPLPSDPSVATDPVERARAAAEWALAQNKSVSMRQADKAREVLKRIL